MRDAVVLCLDLDDNIIASQFHEHHDCKTNPGYFDVNGEQEPIHMTMPIRETFWHKLLQELTIHCQNIHAELLVYIITAKASGETDNTVDAVVKMLHEFLVVLGFDRSIDSQIRAMQMPEKYLYALHTFNKIELISTDNGYCHPSPNIDLIEHPSFTLNKVLPSIHVVTFNVRELGFERCSKVLVMDQIYQALIQHGITPIGMLLVDDDIASYEPDLHSGNHSLKAKTNLVKFIDTKNLCTTSSPTARKTRIDNANNIKDKIMQAIRSFSSLHHARGIMPANVTVFRSGAPQDAQEPGPAVSTDKTPLLQMGVKDSNQYRSRGCCKCRSSPCRCCCTIL